MSSHLPIGARDLSPQPCPPPAHLFIAKLPPSPPRTPPLRRSDSLSPRWTTFKGNLFCGTSASTSREAIRCLSCRRGELEMVVWVYLSRHLGNEVSDKAGTRQVGVGWGENSCYPCCALLLVIAPHTPIPTITQHIFKFFNWFLVFSKPTHNCFRCY